MKELQNFVYRHMDALRHHKRYLAMLTALSMLVTFIVPLILIEPADSMTGILVCNKVVHTHNAECYDGDTLVCDIEEHIHTGACYKKISTVSLKGDASGSEYTDYNIPVPNAGGGYNEDTGSYDSEDGNEVDGVTYNPATLPLYTLLFGDGENHWVNPNKSVEENLEIVDDEYFLGFASDFCAFIESDFTATDADAEGRIFIGGDLTFKNDWNYQVGAGDYGQFKSIWNTDEYGHLKGFASGIIGGKVYRLATMTTGAYSSLSHDTSGITHRHVDKKQNDVFLYPEEGAYKRFIVGNLNASLHYDEDYKTRGDGEKIDLPYEKSCNHLYYDQGCTICENSDKHKYLGEVNELSQFYLYNDVSAILEKTFDTLRARSLSLASVQAIDATINDNGTLSLDASDIGDAKTVYFKINKWDNVKRVVITVPDDRITYTETGDKEEKYSNGNKTIKNLDLNIIVTCGDEEIKITQNVPTFILAKTANEKPDGDDSGYYGYKISNRGTDDGGNATNNHPVSSNILYNFYNAAKVTFTGDTNFNGTIFAPNASVTAPDACRGHLSGALIAKSFKGGLEFGYRPYRGGTDIFGMASGYAIPVNKFGDDGETALPGALFAVKQDGKFVSLFESGNGTNFAVLPSKVDFTGNTTYEQDTVIPSQGDREYAGNTVIGEKLTAPVDFTLSYEDLNNVEIPENGILDVESNKVLTEIYLNTEQSVVLDSNEYFYAKANNNDKTSYTIYLIKPTDSLTITARNAADTTSSKTVTVNFKPENTMVLNVTQQEYNPNDSISFNVTNPPSGNILYKYFVNGNYIDLNNNQQDDDYVQDLNCSYTPNAAGDYTFSVKAYVSIDTNGDNNNEYYEVAQATANKVTIKEAELPDDMKIEISGNTFLNGEITSGNDLTVKLTTVKGLPKDATVEYAFYNSTYQQGNQFGTYGIVGKDLAVKVKVSLPNKTPVELYETVTVNFPEMTLNLNNENYIVGQSGVGLNLNNIPQGATLRCVVNGNSTEYTKSYCNNYEDWYISPKVVGTNIPVDVYVEMNGLTKKFTKYINGKYDDNLRMSISSSPYIVDSNITLKINNAPNGAKVVFEALDSNNTPIWTSATDYPDLTVNNGEATVTFTPKTAGKYTFKAYMTYESNTKREFEIKDIEIDAKPVYGEFSADPQQVNTGNKVNLKVYNATSDASVEFYIVNVNTNDEIKLNGIVGNNGECTVEYPVTQAGEYKAYAIISKDGGSNKTSEQRIYVTENTSTLSGKWEVKSTGTEPGSNVQIYVSEAPNNAIIRIYVTKPGGTEELVCNENMNNSTYNWNYQLSERGTYKFRGELVRNGEPYNLGAKEITIANIIQLEVKSGANSDGNFVIGTPVTLGLQTIPANTVKVDYYLFSLDSNNVMQNKQELNATYDETNKTITFVPGQTGDHQYSAKAYNEAGELIGTMTQPQTFKTEAPEYNIEINTEKDTYYGGDTVYFSISGLPNNKNITSVSGYIEGIDVGVGTSDNANYSYMFVTSNYYTSNSSYVLTIKVTFEDNTTATNTVSIYNLPQTTTTTTNVNVTNNTNPTSVSLAFRRYLSILADENTNSEPDDNLIVINENGETFKSVRLTFPGDVDAKNASFTIKVTFKNAGGSVIGEKTYSKDDVADGNCINITDIDSNVATIEITPVAGSITIANCYPTFTKTENIITQKFAQGFTLKKNEQKEIVLVNWAKEDSTQTLDSITFDIIIEEGNSNKICYALMREGETVPVFIEAPAPNDENKIVITGLNAQNIKSIKIYTPDESLTINDYTISAYVGSSEYSTEQLNALRTSTQEIINTYTLVEQQAPVGYFKEETVYIVEVKETIKFYETAGESPYPRDVETIVTVKKTDGTVVLSYIADIDYSSNDGTNTKTITIKEVTANGTTTSDGSVFTLTEYKDGTRKVESTNSNVDISKWSTATKPVSNDGYYFDPEAMMVVPVPTPIKYTNTVGLLFRKIDTMGAAVKGVEIKLYKLINAETKLYEEVGSDIWYWDENSSEWLIDYDKLESDKVYRLTETYGGGKYEIAENIYFKKTGTTETVETEIGETEVIEHKEIKYWTGSDTMPEDASKITVLNFAQNLETRVIRMKNTRIPGIKISLKKTDMEDKVIGDDTNFAKFCLYAYDGTEILHDIEVKNGQAELDFSNFEGDEKYVSDGYLMPGTYYFKETKAPDGYEASMKYFYFNVVKTDDGAFSIASSELFPDVLLLEEVQPNGDSNKVIRFKSEALEQISDGITAETINADTPIIQFKFKTDNGEIGSGNGEGFANAKFTAIINGKEIRYNSSKLPSGCINHNNGNGIFFRNESVTVQFTVRQLCELFNVSVENFNTIKEFVITSWNSTVVEDLEFLKIENPITGGGSSGGSGSGNEIYTTTKSYYDSGQQKDEAFNVRVVSQGALNRITDSMITSDTTVLKFDVYTSDATQVSQNWGNYRFIGTYNGTETVGDKIQVEQERKTFTLNAKGMLVQLGITPENDSTKLIEQFRKLTSFEIGTVAANATVVENLEFYGVSNETESDNENDTGETPEETVAIPMLSVDRNTIAIPNTPVGNKMNLRVEKRWRGDDGIPELRQPVEVQLMRKVGTGDYTEYNPTGGESGKVTLNEANDWSYIWENLPRYVDDDETKEKYYYTIKELSAITGYETPTISGGDINEGGTVVITNQAKTIDIPAEKIWNNPTEYTPIYPKTVKFKLQVDVNNDPIIEEWKDIPGKTLTITGNYGDWSGRFTGLIEGYEYRVVEVDVPYGWTPDYNDAKVNVPENVTESFNETFTVTNTYDIDEGTIAFAKLWEGENAARPYEIYLDLYRSVVAPSYTKTDAPYTDGKLTGNNDPDYKDDYMRLLQHSLYFYDANMCGTDVSTSSDLAWRTNCHTEDEILGGYHDAGDHVMFGLPQGYTASMLSWMYLEFFKGNVTQSEGNIENIVTDSEGNVTSNGTYMMNHYENDHFKVILDRFYDFFVNSVEYGDNGKIKKLLLQKGQGNIDHLIWCAPEIQKNRENEMIWSETQGSNIAAEYAAALALGYLNFKDTDSAKWEKYLKIAEDLYEFSGRTSSFIASDSEGTYYKETEEPNPASDDRAWAAAWLYEATGIQQYADERLSDSADLNPSKIDEGLQWDDVRFAALCATARSTGNWDTAKDFIQKKYVGGQRKDYYYIHSWGTARFNAMAQTATLIVAKHLKAKGDITTADSYINWAEGQMDKILGNNTWKDTISTNGCVGGTVEDTAIPICLVTNFVPDGFDIDTPQNPHHRAASGLDSVNGDSNLEYKDSCVYDDDSYTLVGALVGGPAFGAHSDQEQMKGYNHKHPLTAHDYIDDLHDYCCNEVAIDYNAGLVGAAAGLYYFRGTGARSTMIEGVEFGSYGLAPIEELDNYNSNKGLESPTKSAIPEVTQDYNVDPANDVAGAVLKTFAMRQTAVSVMADSTSENYCILEEGDKKHTFTNKGGDEKIYDEDIYENVTKIEIDLGCSNSNVNVWTDGIGGIQLEYTEMDESGNTKVVDTGWLENKDGQKPISTLSSISFTSPKKITKLRFHNVQWWNEGNNVIIEEIRVYGTRVMSIAGESKVTVGSEIELDVKSAPEGACFKWISSNENIATVDPSGKVTPKKSGELEITLEAYDNEDLSGDPIATASKSITVVESVTLTESLGTLSKGFNKDFKLSDYLPSGAILKSVSINVSPKDGNTIDGFGGGLMVGDEETKNPWNQQNFSGVKLEADGKTFTLEGEYMNGVDCSIHKFTLGLWGADGTVNINSLTFEYIMDSTFIEIYYTDENERDSKIIRNGESVEFEVKATGGTIGGVQLKNGETVIATYEVIDDETFSLTISPKPGSYTIVAAMGGDNSSKTDSIALTVKDKITINGSEIMDLNGSQKLSVSNAIEGIQWSVTADENYTVEDGDVVTIKESENIIATFNKSTGDVTTFEYDGEFTLTVKDNYNYGDEGSTDSITISITERPKLPELPKEIFRELYIKGNSETIKLSAANNWNFTLADLPTHDEKGNPYYYYIQESGYRQTEGGEYKPLTDQTGHFIYSTNASYMPSAYYNNGVAPDKDNAPDIVAKVGNKLHSKMQGQLPSTGGSGVTTYYYFGGALMLLGIAGFTGLKRRERKRRKE